MLHDFSDRRIIIRLALLEEDAAFETLTPSQNYFLDSIKSIAKILEQSPLGRRLVQSAIVQDISVGLDPLLEANSCFFYPAQNHFDLGYQPQSLHKTEKGMSRYLVSFLGGLRRAWHLKEGCTPDVCLKPEDFIRQCRCADADIEAVTHLIAWELRGAGASFLWRYLLSAYNGDVAVTFEHAILENPYHQFDGTALKAAFNQWFAVGERTAVCDHTALEIMDMALVQYLAQTEPVSGRAPIYIGRNRLNRRLVERLGLLPNGMNYLKGCPFGSSWYVRSDDDFNRVHLCHLQQDILQLLDKNTLIAEIGR